MKSTLSRKCIQNPSSPLLFSLPNKWEKSEYKIFKFYIIKGVEGWSSEVQSVLFKTFLYFSAVKDCSIPQIGRFSALRRPYPTTSELFTNQFDNQERRRDVRLAMMACMIIASASRYDVRSGWFVFIIDVFKRCRPAWLQWILLHWIFTDLPRQLRGNQTGLVH